LLKQIVLNDFFEKIIDKKLDENQIKKIDVNKKILENTKITLKNLEKLENIKLNFEKEEENKKYKEIIKVIDNWKETYEKFESSLKDLYSTKTNQLELRKIEKELEEIKKQIKNEKKLEKKLKNKLLKKLENVKTNEDLIIAKKI
jgi:tRNA-dihydrouridine synthase